MRQARATVAAERRERASVDLANRDGRPEGAALGCRSVGFLEDGYVCLREAFSRRLAERIAEQLWSELSIVPTDRSTWPGPVVRHAPSCPEIAEAASSPRLWAAIEELAGPT